MQIRSLPASLRVWLESCAAVGALVVLSPVLLLTAIAVWWSMGPPVFFTQTRIGLGESEFKLVKFRSMRAPAEGESAFDTDGARVTSLGRFLRRTSLDELPTLWNVVRGEMAFVGPRPLLPVHLEVFTAEQRRRSEVRPGITGLAQVSGRQSLTFSQRTALDLEYVEKRGIGLDARILWRTAQLVARGSGVDTGQELDEVDDVGLAAALRRRTSPDVAEMPRCRDAEMPRCRDAEMPRSD